MKYLIIGAGGTGGAIGAFLAKGGHDVSFIARGEHLKAIRERGLGVKSDRLGNFNLEQVKAYTADEYNEGADVIFVCVKGYSLDEIIPFIGRVANKNTLIIPILNVYGIGEQIQKALPDYHVLDGCIYIVSYISNYGEITQAGPNFRIVYGDFGNRGITVGMRQVEKDLTGCGIDVIISDNIKSETFRKFTFISAYANAGAYYNVNAGAMQADGEPRDLFITLEKEIEEIAKGLNIELPGDILGINLNILDHMTPDTTASMQKDLVKGRKSEMQGILFNVVTLADELHISVPGFQKVAEHFGYPGNA